MQNEVVFDLIVVPYTTYNEELNGETIFYWILDFSKGNKKNFNNITSQDSNEMVRNISNLSFHSHFFVN